MNDGIAAKHTKMRLTQPQIFAPHQALICSCGDSVSSDWDVPLIDDTNALVLGSSGASFCIDDGMTNGCVVPRTASNSESENTEASRSKSAPCVMGVDASAIVKLTDGLHGAVVVLPTARTQIR